MVKRTRSVLLGAAALAFVLAAAQSASHLSINGKAYSSAPIVVKGETYVSVKALQAAGMGVSNDGTTLSLSFTPSGGANQTGSLEGKVNDWLFDGVWRFRVTSIAKASDGHSWDLTVELRNGTKSDDLSLSGTGFDSLRLAMDDGKLLDTGVSEITTKGFAQGTGQTFTLNFADDEGTTRKPDRLILLIKPDDELKKYMKGRLGIAYATADPSFRVKVAGS